MELYLINFFSSLTVGEIDTTEREKCEAMDSIMQK